MPLSLFPPSADDEIFTTAFLGFPALCHFKLFYQRLMWDDDDVKILAETLAYLVRRRNRDPRSQCTQSHHRHRIWICAAL